MEGPAGVSHCSEAVRACSFTFCTKHGGVYTSHRDASLAASVRDQAEVSRYRFGTRTAEFYLCSRCGVVPFVTSEIDGRLYAVVNVNSFEGIDPARFTRAVTDFDGETTEGRLARTNTALSPIRGGAMGTSFLEWQEKPTTPQRTMRCAGARKHRLGSNQCLESFLILPGLGLLSYMSSGDKNTKFGGFTISAMCSRKSQSSRDLPLSSRLLEP